MALVSSGDLHLKGSSGAPTRSIQWETEGNYSGDFSLLDAYYHVENPPPGESWDPPPEPPVSMSWFYDLDFGSTIIYDFSNSITWANNDADDRDGYQALVFTGRNSGDVVTLDVDIEFRELVGDVICSVYYSLNSTSSWTLLQSMTSSTTVSDTIPGVDYNDVVRIRVDITATGSGLGDVTVLLDDGFFTSHYGWLTSEGLVGWLVDVS